ncbi:Kinesin-like protein KIF21B [Eumeta japonica]|uniref:Kinesin-like protein KIF21B n=1 Tax=Eumeta variegata TaxID=151549 RepID=A0A4C1VLT6_EUMVA|nr:Kinesin-like protein KIF21B [Eumeta japonica]
MGLARQSRRFERPTKEISVEFRLNNYVLFPTIDSFTLHRWEVIFPKWRELKSDAKVVRPLSPAEVLAGCGVCARVPPGEPCVAMGADRLFTFDLAFDTATDQRAVYAAAVLPLVKGALHGYNATVLAYGQTGSGKTYTMGSGWEADDDGELNGHDDDEHANEAGERVRRGIIPRALRDLFAEADRECEEARTAGRLPPEFAVHAQFIELYNEELLDLLEPLQARGALRIAEEAGGGVRVLGATAHSVRSARDALHTLRAGALARTTAATAMNTSSSRSHAVFSLLIKSRRLVPVDSETCNDVDADVGPDADQFETLTAKIHFVDLAGSERLKRTGATGERAREGISINSGLLALGNVISALGDRSRRATHVPYRDSKLTRLLQDSLGGNSQTVMIACVSPSDRDFMETLNTLKYANRARNIKNKLVVNQDLSARTIQQLRREVARLQLELQEFRQGKRVPRAADADGGGDLPEDGFSDLYHENLALRAEAEALRTRLKAAQGTVDQLSRRNADLLAERALAPLTAPGEPPTPSDCSLATLVGGYVAEVEELRAKLIEANGMYEAARRRESRVRSQHNSTATLLNDAKRDLQEEKQLLARSMGELEMRRKLEVGDCGDAPAIGERERAEGESADESDGSDGEGDEPAEDEEDSETKACAALSEELAALSGDIDMKARLIEELELSQQRLGALRQHYEQRLQALHQQIKATQEERDKVLTSCVSSPGGPAAGAGAGDKVRRVRDEYERRLADMTRELRRLQAAQSQHARLARDQAATAQELARLRSELQERKREKVKVMQRMREEARRHATAEKVRAKEVAQLRKESRRHANLIRTLRAERDLKEQVLRRKREEVEALRRARRAPTSRNARAAEADARDSWARLARWASRATLARALCGELEAGLERALAERERVRAEVASGVHPDPEAARDHLRYLQQTIADTQQQIMQLEDEGEEGTLPELLQTVRSAEAGRYALERMAALLLQHGHNAARLRTLLQDTQARLRQLEAAAERERLQRAVGGVGLAALVSPGTATRCVSPADDRTADESQCNPDSPAVTSPFATPFQRNSPRRGSVRLRDLGVVPRDESGLMTQSLSEAPPHPVPLARVPSAPGGLRYAPAACPIETGATPPVLQRRPLYRGLAPASPPQTPPGESPRAHRSLVKPASLYVSSAWRAVPRRCGRGARARSLLSFAASSPTST